jgi:hypothetical protein
MTSESKDDLRRELEQGRLDLCLRLLAQALYHFQFLEEGIRIYLERAYRLVHHRMKGDLAIRLSPKGIRNRPLKDLLREFKKFNSNDDLINEISRLNDRRNEVAHVAFYQMFERLSGGSDVDDLSNKASETTEKASKCVDKLLEEIKSIEKLCRKEGLMASPDSNVG